MKPKPIPVLSTEEQIGGLAKTVSFDVPENLRDQFTWTAGQHLTLCFHINGEEVRRCYTISSSPTSGDPLRITVKRVKGGLVSNHINDNVQKGHTVDLLPPGGSFQLIPEDTERRTHYFIGAGSGITPLFAMLHTVLTAEPYSQAHLLYANRNDESIIFSDTLRSLSESYPDRLTVSHIFSAPRLLSSFPYWKSGKIDATLLEKWITENSPYAQDCQYYLCGPGTMNRDLKLALQSLDVPSDRIHFESFGGGDSDDTNDGIKSCPATAQVTLDGKTHTVQIAQDQTILEAVRAAGLTPPFSCQSGICGQCQATLSSGTCEMKSHAALDDSDLETQKILTCQSLCTSPELEFIYP